MQNRPNPSGPRRMTRRQYEALQRQRRQNRLAIAAIAAIAGLALSGVFALTKDTIADQQRAAQAASYLVVCPGADTATCLRISSLLSALFGLEGNAISIQT